MKSRLTAALILCLTGGCILLALGWRDADTHRQIWQDQALAAEQQAEALEQALTDLETQEHDPIAAFFDRLPYSGATAGYLAFLEYTAYQTELEHAAALLKNNRETDALIDEFVALVDSRAQAEAEAWNDALTSQEAVTAGAWAHLSECQIPVYQFGARTLISACQRDGKPYSFLFSAGEVRQELLAAGFPEDFLPPYKGRLLKIGMLICTN